MKYGRILKEIAFDLNVDYRLIADRFLEFPGGEIKLDLSNMNMGFIPSPIFRLWNLSHLILCKNNITELPDGINSLKMLKHLDLSENKLQILPKELSELTDLQYLDLSRNKIVNIPDSVSNLTELHTLDMRYNKLKDLNLGFSKLQGIVSLELSDNLFETIPICVTRMPQLASIHLQRNRVRDFTTDFRSLINLRNIDISENSVREIDPSWIELPSIDRINLSGNHIRELPSQMPSTLSWLDITGNKVERISGVYLNLDKFLGYIPDTQFNSLSEQFSLLSDNQNNSGKGRDLLPYLDNRLSVDRAGFINLDLSSLDLHEVPANILILKSLKELNLSDNRIEYLPDHLNKLRNLTHLDLSNNRLNEFDYDISRLPSLKYIDLSHNQIECIPAIAKYSFIRELYVNHNLIKELQIEWKNMVEINTINISNNPIDRFPQELLKIKTLERVYVDDDQFNKLDENPFLKRENLSRVIVV